MQKTIHNPFHQDRMSTLCLYRKGCVLGLTFVCASDALSKEREVRVQSTCSVAVSDSVSKQIETESIKSTEVKAHPTTYYHPQQRVKRKSVPPSHLESMIHCTLPCSVVDSPSVRLIIMKATITAKATVRLSGLGFLGSLTSGFVNVIVDHLYHRTGLNEYTKSLDYSLVIVRLLLQRTRMMVSRKQKVLSFFKCKQGLWHK